MNVLRLIRLYINRLIILKNAVQFDVIWVEKEIFPWIPYFIEQRLFPPNVPIIVDYDDAIFHRYDQSSNGIIRYIFSNKIDQVMRAADIVITGNDYLKVWAEKAGARRVIHLPTVVDLKRYSPKYPNGNIEQTVVGWVGSPITAKYLESLGDIISSLSDSKNIQFVAIGANHTQFNKLPIEKKEWSVKCEVSEIQKFDIGIMPIPDEPFERGKCAYKIIQYMACGIPVVASPVGMNSKVVKQGINGFLASTNREWASAIKELSSNPSLRKKLGDNGRNMVEEQYCLDKTAPILKGVLTGMIERKIKT